MTLRTLLLWLVCQSMVYANDWQNPEYIENAFIEIALKNEYKPNHKHHLLKWQSPITYELRYYQLAPYQPLEELINRHFQHLSEITHHPIRQGQPANFHIILTRDQFYQNVIEHSTSSNNTLELSRSSNCMAQIQSNSQGEIVKATVIIPVDHATSAGLLATCVVEELTQAMGLPNDSDWVHPSIANDKSLIEFLTGLDYLLLKLLYSDGLKAGMPEKQVRQIIKPQLKAMQQDGIIQKSPGLVNQSGLYRYLN